jgi:hypothetical protein
MPTWSCVHCDLTYPYVLVRDVACPNCGAAAGRNCRRPSGHPVWGAEGRWHFDRDRAALKAGAITLCPKAHTQAAHREAQDAARAAGGFKPIVPVPDEAPTGKFHPQRGEYESETRKKARVAKRLAVPEAERRPSDRRILYDVKPEPEVVAHAPSWMVGAFGMENLVKEGLVVEEPSPGVTSVLVGKQVVPVPAKRPAVTLDSFA